MPVNVALLNKVMEHIEAHPEEHDQKHWGAATACGTKFCFAAHAIIICGYEPVFDLDGIMTSCRDSDGRERTVSQAAQLELGISAIDAHRIFYNAETTQDLRILVDEIGARGS